MGFMLIGIKKVIETESPSDLKEQFNLLLKDESIGIIVTNDKTVDKLEANFRRNVLNSIAPVVVVLSTSTNAQDNLRDMIKKAIGIDLLAK